MKIYKIIIKFYNNTPYIYECELYNKTLNEEVFNILFNKGVYYTAFYNYRFIDICYKGNNIVYNNIMKVFKPYLREIKLNKIIYDL